MSFPGFSGWRRPVLVIALAGGAIGAGGLAIAATTPGNSGWRHGPRLGRIQHVVREALDSVGATTAQEDKVHDIIAAAFSDMQQDRAQHVAMRKQVLDLLRAPTIDRDAVEKLRSEQVARFDARSKKMVGALLDAADQLTPEQRGKLADRLAWRMEHRDGREGRMDMNRDSRHFVHDHDDGPDGRSDRDDRDRDRDRDRD